MPLALIAIGLVLLIATIRGKQDDLFNLLKSDFTGPGNFLYWIMAIGVVGAVGYFKPARPVANAFLVLLVVIFLLAANKGGKDFFTSLFSQVKGASNATPGPSPGSVDAEHPFGDYVLGGDLGASALSAFASQLGNSFGSQIAAQSGG